MTIQRLRNAGGQRPAYPVDDESFDLDYLLAGEPHQNGSTANIVVGIQRVGPL